MGRRKGSCLTKEQREKISTSMKSHWSLESSNEKRKKYADLARSDVPKTKEQIKAYHREHNSKKREFVRLLLIDARSSGCELCGENHPACLDFHHKSVTDKTVCVSSAIRFGKKKAIEFIKTESSKCIILCSNCHRKLHFDSGTRRGRKKYA